MADVSNWVFGDESEFLVGPIVGRVTETSARLVVEASNNVTAIISVTSEVLARPKKVHEEKSEKADGSDKGEAEGEEAITGTEEKEPEPEIEPEVVSFELTKDLKARKPTAIEIHGLAGGLKVFVSIQLGDQTRVASFRTPSPNNTTWNVGLISCNKLSTMVDIGMWEVLASNVSEIDCILHMGDQVYGDDDFKTEGKTEEEIQAMGDPSSSCWGQSKDLVNAPGVDGNFEPLREQVKEIYSGIYRQTWSHPPVASALAGVSNLMMLDDHEITDDTGDVPEHLNRSTWEYFVITCAYQIYRAYQAQLNYPVEDVDDYEQKAYWHTELYPGIGVFFLDVRLERSLLRHQLEEMDWENCNYLGPRQTDELKSVMNGSFKDMKTVLMVSPTPPIFLSSTAASLVELKSDDVVGSWSNKKFAKELSGFLQVVTDWQNGRPDRAIVLCSGDIHVGGFSDVLLDSGGPLINQVISSAIGNLPEASVGALKAVGSVVLAASAMQTDMRINHTAWVWDPNYGVLKIEPPSMANKDRERPTITATLVSKDAKKTHELQYSINGGLCGEALHGCQCTTS